MTLVDVYHGTARGYLQSIEDHGLPPARPGTPGAHVHLTLDEARLDARGACARARVTVASHPRGIVLGARIDRSRVVDRRGALRVPDGIRADELHYREIEFPDLIDNWPAIHAALTLDEHRRHARAAGPGPTRARRS